MLQKCAVVVLLLATIAGAQTLPDAPSATKQKIFTKTFVGLHVGFLAATVYDEEMTHAGLAHHVCVERTVNPPRPSRGDLYKNGLLYFAGFTALDIALKAYGNHLHLNSHFSDVLGSVGAIVGTGKHLYGGTQWATNCW